VSSARRSIVRITLFAALAALTLAAAIGRQLQRHPCPGHLVPEKIDEVAAHAWELPVVARAKLLHEDADPGCGLISYPTSGTTTYGLGPIGVRQSWTQAGNDAHTLGPRSITMHIVDEADASGFARRPWSDPLFSGPDFTDVARQLELRYDAGRDAYLLVGYFFASALQAPSAWTPLIMELPGRASPTPGPGETLAFARPDDGVAFRVERHPGGDRGLRSPGSMAASMVLLVAGTTLLRAVSRLRRRVDWREGTVEEGGFIMAHDTSERLVASDARLIPGQTVLFPTAQRADYRTSAVSPALEIHVGSRAEASAHCRRLLVLAGVAVLFAAALAIYALLAPR
jgi:hypothetical protein